MNDYHGRDWEPQGRCSGQCCRTVSLSASPERIAIMAAGSRYRRARWRNQLLSADAPTDRWLDEPQASSNRDALFVDANFVRVRDSYWDGIYTDERTWMGGIGIADGKIEIRGPAKPVPQYRCKAFDGSGCTKYNERPDFCRRFGTPEQRCRVPGCTLTWRAVVPDSWENEGGASGPNVS